MGYEMNIDIIVIMKYQRIEDFNIKNKISV